jgi:TP901 family phage tail tape measure protein
MSVAGSGNDVVINLVANDGMSPVFTQVSAAMGVFSGNVERTVYGLTRLGAEVAPVIALGAAFVYMGQQASAVQQNVANLNSVLHTTSEQLAAIRQNGLALSQATQFTDAQILQAQRQLARGGASPADLAIQGGAGISGATLNLAGATQNSPTQAAQSLIAAQRTYGLSNDDAARTATTLAQAANTSVASFAQQTTALSQAGAVARGFGKDLGETEAALVSFQNAGMVGDSGTGLRTFLTRLAAPTKAAKDELDALGVAAYNSQGQLKSIPDLMDEIRNKTIGLDDETKNTALFRVFGQRGIRTAEIAAESGSSPYTDERQRMAEAGTAADMNAEKLNTFQGTMSKATASINVLAVQLGTTLIPGMKAFAQDTLDGANALTSLNNNATLLPQLAVGVAAIMGVRRVSSAIQGRRDDRDEATQSATTAYNQTRTQRAADIANDVAQAEFAADSKILASHQQMTAAMQALDEKQYEAWRANEEKIADQALEVDARRLASLQTLTEKTLASIAQIDAAYNRSIGEQIDRQALQFEKQQAFMDISQQTEREKLAVRQGGKGQTPESRLAVDQDIERKALIQRQAVEQDMLQRDLEIQQRGVEARKAQTADGAAQMATQIERSAQVQADAIIVGGNRVASAHAEAGAREMAAIRARQAEEVVAAEKGYLAAVGTNAIGPGPGAGAQMVEGSIMAKYANMKEPQIPANMKVVAGNMTADEEGIFARARGMAAGWGTRLGNLIMPVTIALLAKDFIFSPITKAIIDKAASGDAETNTVHVQTRMVIDHPADDQRKAAADIDAQARSIQELINKKQEELKAKQDSGWEHVPVLSGIANLTGLEGKDIGALKKEIESLTADLSDLSKQGAVTKLIPEQEMSRASDEINTILTRMKDGTITQAQAEAQWRLFGASVDETTGSLRSHDEEFRRLGLTTEQITAKNREFVTSEEAVAKSLREAKEQAQLDYRTSAQQAVQAEPLGVDPQTITRAYFGKNTDQTDATKAQIDAAKRQIADYQAAFKTAESVVNQIDISKGINAFGELAPRLDEASKGLDKIGQSNTALQGLTQIADSFHDIVMAEHDAMRALDGYNLTLDKTTGYMSTLDRVQKQFESAVQDALARQAAGRATAADMDIITNRPAYESKLLDQRQQLSQNLVLDVLGEVKNLPDFKALDDYVRDVVAKTGGGLKVVATIQTNLESVKQDLDRILGPRTMDVTINPIFSQFDPAIADRAKSWSQYYQNMGGNSPYDERSGGPPGGPPLGPNPDVGPQTSDPSRYPAGSSGSSLAYQPLDFASYDKIIKGGARGASPLDDPDVYKTFIAAAQRTNVDPRLMLDAMKYENGFATDIGLDLNMANNFAGITYVGQQGATRGPARPANEGGNYAAFASPEDFFMALARNLSTGAYSQDFDSGNVQAIRKRYTPGSSQQDLENFSNTYQGYVQQYPVQGGGAGGYSPQRIASSEHLTTQQNIEQANDVVDQVSQDTSKPPGGGTNAIYQAAVRDIGQKKDKFGNDVYGWCLEIVQDIMQQAGFDERAKLPNSVNQSADSRLRAAENGVPGAGRVINRSDARPGDIVGWTGDNPSAGDPRGHIGIYAGGDQYIGTTQNGVQQRTIAPGAIFIRPDGVVANGPVPGSVPYTYNPSLTPAQNSAMQAQAGAGNPYNPIPYPTAAAGLIPGYQAQMASLDATGQGQTQKFFDMLAPVFKGIETDRAGFGPTGPEGRLGVKPGVVDQANIDNAAMRDNLDLTTRVGAAIQNINQHLPVTAAQYAAINAAAGPLGSVVEAQVRATEQLEVHTTNLNNLKDDQRKADEAYARVQDQRATEDRQDSIQQTRQQWARQDADRRISDQRRVITEGEQDFDRSRARNKALQDRDIQDQRTQQQRNWQDEANAIQDQERGRQEMARLQDVADQAHKQSIDDAFTTASRAQADQQRILEFRGGQESIDLQDAKKRMDEQHRFSTEGMQQQSSLYVSLGKGSDTEAQAQAYASQAAAINDARKQADLLYQRQSETNQRQQDDLSKTHAQQVFNLQTEMIATQRKHEDDLKGIDRTAQQRHNSFAVESFDIQTRDIMIQRSHLMITRQQEDEDKMRSRLYENDSFAIEGLRILEQRRWKTEDENLTLERQDQDRSHQEHRWQIEDLRQAEDFRYKENKRQNEEAQAQEQLQITSIGKQISGLDEVIAKYGTLLSIRHGA